MRYTITPLKCLVILAGIAGSFMSFAINSKTIEDQAESSISALYHRLKAMPNTSMTERIDWFSEQFKGRAYLLGSLGEGPNARYDQYPRYRTDAFDCDTYVNTVLALALANSLKTFQECLKYTRYQDGKIAYIHRNHFTSIDWNKNNQQRGMLKDITLDIKNEDNKPVAQFAHTMIDKANWYAYKTVSTIRLQKENKAEQQKRLTELKAKMKDFKPTPSDIPYIPLSALFFADNTPNQYLFTQIPQGAIIEIIRPNWDLRQQIGTALNVSHLGFAIWKKDQLYYREASSQLGAVVDVPFIQYLKEAKKSPTIKGINVQVMVPVKPVVADCSDLKQN
ncbi:MAG: DUF1460 domain-containing protein [Legionella sp.]|nr:MAG: DUF1460 domain-containing protein [Legionella sp.]